MNILIAEDEPLAAERLSALVKRCDSLANIVLQTDTVAEAIEYLVKPAAKIDLLLLDIQLADGKSFRILEQTKTNIPIIFTTAYDQYAIQAFKFHSIDYLLKPIQQHELQRALTKFKERNETQTISYQEVVSLRQTFEEFSKRYKQRFVAKAGNKLFFVETKDVAYFFADGKTVYLVSAKDRRKHIIDHTLDEVEGLTEPLSFFRISRKFIVNLSSVAEVKGTNANMSVKLSIQTEHELTVSRERSTEFKRWLDQ